MGTFDNTLSILEGASSVLGIVPVVGDAISMANVGYHGGSAIYDGITGDRDGAIAHGTQAAWNAAGLVIDNDTLDQVDAGVGMLGTMGRTMVAGDRGDASQVPCGIGDLLSGGAVAATNALFGADDSNWIAPGETPQGTRGGEIAFGGMAMGAGMGIPFGAQLGKAAAPLIGELLGADLGAPTSGAGGPEGWVKALSEAL